MYCGKCGAVVPDGTKFCADCGEPVAPAAVGRTGRMSKEQRDALILQLGKEKGWRTFNVVGDIVLLSMALLGANMISAGFGLCVTERIIKLTKEGGVLDKSDIFFLLLKCSLPGFGFFVFFVGLSVLSHYLIAKEIKKIQDRLDADSE